MTVALTEQLQTSKEHSCILSSVRYNWEKLLTNHEKKIFFYKSVQLAIDAALKQRYTLFDAHTSSNCCHGIAAFALELIKETFHLDLAQIRQQCIYVSELEEAPKLIPDWIPDVVIHLTSLFVLCFASKKDSEYGRLSDIDRLLEIYPVSKKFYNKLTGKLKKAFSNYIAVFYKDIASNISGNPIISEAPFATWEKYVQDEHIKSDENGTLYAPCLFSMQVTLAHLIQSRAKIVFYNLITDQETGQTKRLINALKGNGYDRFDLIHDEELSLFEPLDLFEPVTVFGGCSFSNSSVSPREIENACNDWMHHVERLILACDMHYPQYPNIINDNSFISASVLPTESALRNTMFKHAQIEGVKASYPTLFCLSHIYPASLGEVLSAKGSLDKELLPDCLFGTAILSN